MSWMADEECPNPSFDCSEAEWALDEFTDLTCSGCFVGKGSPRSASKRAFETKSERADLAKSVKVGKFDDGIVRA
jgi:hypothetical protein